MIKQILSKLYHCIRYDIVNCIQGNVRYFFYKYKMKCFLSKETVTAYKNRIKDAQECYINGECLHCGCKTPQLFMADRACKADKPCYLEMNNASTRLKKWIGKIKKLI